jgi:2-polyprenyl-6-methoxyphenol hydroxylase-like FAD-dependent oxidoreductase
MSNSYDVIIGGAGPVGLFLACELGMAGISVLVLEREAQIRTPSTAPPLGFRGVNTVSIEAFYRRGLLDKLISDPDGERATYFEKTLPFKWAGHFAGNMFDGNKMELSRWKYRLPGPSLIPGRTDLESITTMLSERTESYGVTIIRGNAVTSISQDNDSVTVHAGDQVYSAKYLVGCDGGRSTIRKEAGFEFVGTEATATGYIGLCELEDAEKLRPGFQATPMGIYIVADFGPVYVMDFDGAVFDRTQTVTLEQFQKVLRHVSGTNVTVKALRLASTWTDRALQATTYRKDRILLAGDSAHIHSPLGAQGLNAGIGDAMNLGWKLAATIKGTAADSLLETYTEERHPIGAWVLEWTRAQATILKPGLAGAATAKIIRDLIDTTDGTNYFIDRFWGLSQRYDLGDEHPLVGSSAPDFEFADGTRLGNKMESGRALLVDFSNNSSLAELAGGCNGKVDYVSAQVKENLDLKALLVRPDGIVAWLAEEQTNLETAKSALLRWFGSIQEVDSTQKSTLAAPRQLRNLSER